LSGRSLDDRRVHPSLQELLGRAATVQPPPPLLANVLGLLAPGLLLADLGDRPLLGDLHHPELQGRIGIALLLVLPAQVLGHPGLLHAAELGKDLLLQGLVGDVLQPPQHLELEALLGVGDGAELLRRRRRDQDQPQQQCQAA
jgi:hypothetical protein